jgi:hypothetical protein
MDIFVGPGEKRRRQILPGLNQPARAWAKTGAGPILSRDGFESLVMKVGGFSGVGAAQASSPRTGGAAAAGGFAVPEASGADTAAPASQVAGPTGVGSIDALLALQGVAGPLERRRKAVRRASVLLDVLDDVKVALLDGGVSSPTLGRLIEAIRQERAETGDPKLEALLDEIETRAAVELAKLEPASAA